jgi:hypothetical protein
MFLCASARPFRPKNAMTGAMEMARQILGNIDSSDGNGAVGGR